MHTPGPWLPFYADDGSLIGIGTLAKRRSGEPIPTIHASAADDGPLMIPNPHDVGLLLAAPVLLEALEMLAEAVEMDVSIFPNQPHKESRLGLARRAIAEARTPMSHDEAVPDAEHH